VHDSSLLHQTTLSITVRAPPRALDEASPTACLRAPSGSVANGPDCGSIPATPQGLEIECAHVCPLIVVVRVGLRPRAFIRWSADDRGDYLQRRHDLRRLRQGACSSHGGVDAKATAAAKQVTCADGSASKSGRGACSGHGGVKSVLPWTVRLRHCATGFVRASDLQRRQSNLVRSASLPRRQPNRDGLVRGQRRLARGSRRRARLRRREAPAKEDADSGDREHPSDDTDDPSRNVLRRFDRDDLPRGISASAGAIRARFVNAPVRCFRDGGPFPSFRSPT
jgi:hypothetical protein